MDVVLSVNDKDNGKFSHLNSGMHVPQVTPI